MYGSCVAADFRSGWRLDLDIRHLTIGAEGRVWFVVKGLRRPPGGRRRTPAARKSRKTVFFESPSLAAMASELVPPP